MKKHLIAAAVAAAVAAPAMAQVTVSGTLETGYVSFDRDDADDGRYTASSLGAQQATSVLEFKGSEDLGGGLKASFTLGQEFAGADGISGGAWDNDGARLQTAKIDLDGSFGTISMGTFAHATRDAGGVYRFMGNIGRVAAEFNSGDTQRDSIQYVSPAFGGFKLSFGKGDQGRSLGNL
jgi:predicted porin